MNTLREAAEAVMEQLRGGFVAESDPVAQDLKAALAEPVQEPLGMTRDDIIRMAREAGMERVIEVHKDGTCTIELPHPDLLRRFAVLVAAVERKACENLWETLRFTDEKIADHLKAAVEAEREACAKVCEAYDVFGPGTRDRFAEAIRARGTT